MHLFNFCLLGLSGVARVLRKLFTEHLSHKKICSVKVAGKSYFANYAALTVQVTDRGISNTISA